MKEDERGRNGRSSLRLGPLLRKSYTSHSISNNEFGITFSVYAKTHHSSVGLQSPKSVLAYTSYTVRSPLIRHKADNVSQMNVTLRRRQFLFYC